MLDWVGLFVGALFAFVPVFTLRALVFALHKRGKSALRNMGAGALFACVGVAAGLCAAFYLQPSADDPTTGFRGLASTALQIAYDASWVFALGLPLSLWIGFRTHRSAEAVPR